MEHDHGPDATETVCPYGQVIAHYVSDTGLAGPGVDLSRMAAAAPLVTLPHETR
jgi:hypothetical protein